MLAVTFVNRWAELAALDSWWERPGAQMGVVWGRRRVGKTWLLRHWARDKRAVFHVARVRPRAQELDAISRTAAGTLPPSRRNLLDRPFADWDDLFETFAEAAESEPLLLVIDEFPDLLHASPKLDSELRAIWERVASDTQLRVILCGSAVGTMEALQTQRAPLYGRATLRLQVHPFRPHEAALMLSALSPAERAKAWGVCGGTPFYLSLWDCGASFRDNLARLFCNEHALLLDEGDLVLVTEDVAGRRGERLPEQVLRTVASGRTKHREIEASIQTLPDRALDLLVRRRLIERVVPVTERGPSRLGYYRVADNFLAFWLDVVERHRPAIELGQGASIVRIVEQQFDDFMGARWESAFRDWVRRRTAEDPPLIPDVSAVGEYWRLRAGPQEDPCQIDALALVGRSRRVGLVGEAKWARRERADRIAAGLARKVTTAGLSTISEPQYVVCAREQLHDVPDGVLAVTAADIFG